VLSIKSLFFAVLAVGLIRAVGAPPTVWAQGAGQRLFLPAIQNGATGNAIRGTVTAAGAPASGVVVELRRADDILVTTVATATTDAGGAFAFDQTRSLPPTSAYTVRYHNATDAARLRQWITRPLTGTAASGAVSLPVFDIANVPLAGPAEGTVSGLPLVFTWTRRPASPSDSYRVELFDATGTTNFSGSTPLQGYVSSLTLGSIDGSFPLNSPLTWTVTIELVDGSYGEAFETRTVTFTNRGALPFAGPVAGG
jgi:hypothetical protein